MYEIEFQQRRRQAIARLGVLVLLGLVALISILPRANARDEATLTVADVSSKNYLLSPQPISSAQFGAFVAPRDRASLIR